MTHVIKAPGRKLSTEYLVFWNLTFLPPAFPDPSGTGQLHQALSQQDPSHQAFVPRVKKLRKEKNCEQFGELWADVKARCGVWMYLQEA